MGKWLAGIDIGGTTVKLAFITEEGAIAHQWEIVTRKEDGGTHIMKDVVASIDAKLAELNETRQALIAAGAGAPGAVDGETGLVYGAVNIGWNQYPLRQLLQDELGIPVAVDNDANCAAVGEMWKGGGRGAKNVIAVTLGTGVGGGIIAGGRVIHGVGGAGGEIGHITSVIENGYPCNCGKSGCLETVASATGIARVASDWLTRDERPSTLRQIDMLTAKDVVDAAKAGDEVANEALTFVYRHLALVLSHLVNSLNPEKIVIGGGVSKAGDFLLDGIRPLVQQWSFAQARQQVTLEIAQLGNDAGIIGAAYLALQQTTPVQA